MTDLVEKPDAADAPSNLAIIGRYVLAPEVFDVLAETPPGRGGEIQLTDALRTLAERPPDGGGPVHGVLFRGRRYDTGDKADYLRTIVRLACDREDLGPEFLDWLTGFVAERVGGDGQTGGGQAGAGRAGADPLKVPTPAGRSAVEEAHR